PAREIGLGLQPVLRREQPRGYDHGVEPAQRRAGDVERSGEVLRPFEIARRDPDRSGGARRAHLDVPCAQREIAGIAAEQKKRVTALGEPPGQRPPDPFRRPEDDDLSHTRSPNSRTDCALRSLPWGSQIRRTRWNSWMRGSIARKCSARVNASLA